MSAIIPCTIREIPYGGHEFVMARPTNRDWSDYDGSTMKQGRAEFRPCMIRGHNSGQSMRCIGSPYAHPLSEFELLVGGDEAWQNNAAKR
jgi:hypothetical protein